MFKHQSVIESTVPVRKLHDIKYKNYSVGFIKIDVEGFELDVLRGGVNVIAKDRPILMIEISKAHNPDFSQTLAFLEKQDYCSFVLTKDGLRTDVLGAIEKQPISLSNSYSSHEEALFDFLFVPIEMADQIKNLILK